MNFCIILILHFFLADWACLRVDISDVLGYELSQFPPALFEIRNVFCEPDKPKLTHSITGHLKEEGVDQPQSTPQTKHYFLDGGSFFTLNSLEGWRQLH